MSRAPEVDVIFQGRLGGYAAGLEDACRRTLQRAARELDLHPSNEISLLLCDSPTIRRINRRWRGKDAPTDVLSFPLNEMKAGRQPPPGPLGDIVVALPVARRAARSLAANEDRHLAHLLIHGLLHLLGYDHLEDRDAAKMERLERRLLDEVM